MKCSSIFNKKVYLRTRSVERDDSYKNKRFNLTNYNYIPCFTTTSNEKKILTPGLRNIYYKNNLNVKSTEFEKNDSTINEEDELYDKEKIYADEIKNLMKERNDEINNIIIKYEDKISKMKKGNSRKFLKSIQTDEPGIKNRFEKKRIYTSRWKLRNTNSSLLGEKKDENYYY